MARLSLVLVLLAACHKAAPIPEGLVVEHVTPPPAPVVEAAPPPPMAPVPQVALAPVQLRTVYFDFDMSDLRPDTLASLAENARKLQSRTDLRVLLEGHCDERGTIEYNLALGDRRATSVEDYLVMSGISPSRIDTVSYGEERPAAPGHDEASWAMNRRVEFVVQPAEMATAR